MLAYILGAGFRDSKSGQKGLKYGQVKGFQIAAKRLQIGVGTFWDKEISNRGKRDFKLGQGLQIGGEQVSLLVVVFKYNIHLKVRKSFKVSNYLCLILPQSKKFFSCVLDKLVLFQ